MEKFKFMFILVLICAISMVTSETNKKRSSTTGDSEKNVRKKRLAGPWFPYNSCIATAVVLVIPLIIKNRNVYMSYNFETNFYLPYFDTRQGLVPLPFATIDEPGVNAGTILAYKDPLYLENVRKLDGDDNIEQIEPESNSTTIEPPTTTTANSSESNSTTNGSPNVTFKKTNPNASEKTKNKKKKPKKKSKQQKKSWVNRELLQTILSRKKFYKMLEHKLDLSGFNGEECVLKAICETAEQPLEEHNGVLGDIIHILFTPTTSRDEKLPKPYYEAVEDGKTGRCRYYHTLCPVGIFDLITKTLDKI